MPYENHGCQTFSDVKKRGSSRESLRELASFTKHITCRTSVSSGNCIFLEDRQHSADAPHKPRKVLYTFEIQKSNAYRRPAFKKHGLPIVGHCSSLRVSTKKNQWSSKYKHHRALQGTCLGLRDPPLYLHFCQLKWRENNR